MNILVWEILGNTVTAIGGGIATVASGGAAVYSAGVTAVSIGKLPQNIVKFSKTERMGHSNGNAPRSNQAQNKQFKSVEKNLA